MELNFFKYQGAGNDFVLIDDRLNTFQKDNNELVAFLCDRNFGIGADGLMLLKEHADYDFEMVYYNADGQEGSLCGNGGRCIVAFAHYLALFDKKCTFLACDGPHEAEVLPNKWVSLKMSPLHEIEQNKDFSFLNTGSPHYVKEVLNLHDLDVFAEGKKVRFNERFNMEGTNVNFVELKSDALYVRTYERGVENETLACGTGVTAAVLALHKKEKIKQNSFDVKALGGNLKVVFECKEGLYDPIYLQGPAEFVFKGQIDVE